MIEHLEDLAHEYLQALLRGEKHVASRLITDSVATGTPVKDVYLRVFQCSQYEVGRLWQTNQISVAQEHYCTAATQLIMSQLYSYIFSAQRKDLRMVGTCVAGELHELGIRMVSDFFELEGWDTFYLGASTPADSVVKALIDHRAHILAISATLPAHVRLVAELIEKVRNDLREFPVRIISGGYPFKIAPDMWRTVGADGSALDAREAVATAMALVKTSS